MTDWLHAQYRWAIGWGLAEATFFFIVPDVLFTRTTVVSLRRGWLQLLGAVFGAVLGGYSMYIVAERRPEPMRSFVAHVPFVGRQMVEDRAQTWRTGTLALFANPLSGVPYKVDAVLAPSFVSGAEFLALSVPLRLERMALSMIVFVPVALWVRRGGPEESRRERELRARWFHAVFWALVYVVYWSTH